MNNWFTGSGEEIIFEDIISIIKDHASKAGVVSIGVDSCVRKDKCTFSAAICLHGATNQHGGRYFFRRNEKNKSDFPALMPRIMAEVQRSIELGIELSEHIPELEVEIHLDVSEKEKEQATSKFADMLAGYARGAGFTYKLKPDSFAAMSVADKHSK
jgi:uncharacterized protein